MGRLEKWVGRSNRRHLVVAIAASAAAFALFFLLDLSTEVWEDGREVRKAEGLLWRYNVATGSVALALLAVTMSFGPIRVLKDGRRPAVHLPWRRVTGIWTAVFAFLHFPGGLAVHSVGWRVWVPFQRIVPKSDNLVDSFGVAYWAGLLAVVSLAILAMTSRDASLRRLGAVRWKRLHRLAYGALGLVVVHVLAMQYGERRDIRHALLTVTVLLTMICVQAAGFLIVRRRSRPQHPQVPSPSPRPTGTR